MRTNLNEEIQKNLKLMGILNEAPSPTKGLFKILFKNLFGSSLDNAIAKIEAKTGQKMAGKGIAAFEAAVSSGKITRKEATKYIVDALLASGKSMDDVVGVVAGEAPNFMKSLERASKSGVDASEIKAAVPELSELSDDLVDALLSKSGFKKIGNTKADILKVLGEIKLDYPTLFAPNSFWAKMVGKGEFKYAERLADLQTKILEKFKGKNQQAVMSEIKKMTDEAEAAIDKITTMSKEEKSTWKQSLKKYAVDAGLFVKDKMILKVDPNTGDVIPLGTGLKLIGWITSITLVSNFFKGSTQSGTVSGGIGYTAGKEFQGAQQGFNAGNVKAVEYAYNTADFYKWLDANEGTLNWTDKSKWDIYVDDDGHLVVNGIQDNKSKKYEYLKDKKTYQKL